LWKLLSKAEKVRRSNHYHSCKSALENKPQYLAKLSPACRGSWSSAKLKRCVCILPFDSALGKMEAQSEAQRQVTLTIKTLNKELFDDFPLLDITSNSLIMCVRP
jgi:hypothetical protein